MQVSGAGARGDRLGGSNATFAALCATLPMSTAKQEEPPRAATNPRLMTPALLDERWPLARHLSGRSGAPFCRLLSVSVDALVEGAVEDAGGMPGGVCILAQGGYGRFELSPCSDVDLLVLADEVDTEAVEELLGPFCEEIREAGLRPSIGHRTLEETLELVDSDMKTAVALLDTRHLAGSPEAYGRLRVGVEEEVVKKRAAKLVRFLRSEAELRRDRLRSHWYLLEPNLKLSEGGLRDVHSVRWIQRLLSHIGEKVEAISEVQLHDDHAFLLWLRNALHVLARWHQDQLTFEHQDALIAELRALPQAPYRFSRAEDLMRAYHLHARRAARCFRLWLSRAGGVLHGGDRGRATDRPVPSEPGVVIREGRLALGESVPEEDLETAALRLFRCMARTGLPLHHTLHERLGALPEEPAPFVLDDPAARKALLELVCGRDQGARALERCHDVGLLARVLPEFEPLGGCFQRSIYHLYPVDVHSLRAVAALDDIAQGRVAGAEIAHELLRSGYAGDTAVYVAVLLHDLEKATRGDQERAHRLLNTALARLHIDEPTSAEVHFLVAHHLRLAVACQKMDLSDDHALLGVAREVGNVERLDRLYLVTQADMRGVNPDLISSWQFKLLDTLYLRLRAILQSGLDLWRDPEAVVERRVAQVVRSLVGRVPSSSHPVFEMARRHYQRLPTRYALHTLPQDVPVHMRLLMDVDRKSSDLEIETRRVAAAAGGASQSRAGLTEVIVATRDQPNLLSCLTAGFAALTVSIHEAHIFSTLDGLALDIFLVDSDLVDPNRAKMLHESVSAALSDPEGFEARVAVARRSGTGLSARGPVPAPHVAFDDKMSVRFLAVEICAQDRVGLLHDLTRALTAAKLDIHLARVATEGPMARDVFLVSEIGGGRPQGAKRTRAIERALLDVAGG